MSDIEHLAQLAQLDLSGEDSAQLRRDLDRILEMVETIRSADVPEDTEPLRHPLELGLRTREDRVSESDDTEAVMTQAPKTAAGLFLVPKVLD